MYLLRISHVMTIGIFCNRSDSIPYGAMDYVRHPVRISKVSDSLHISEVNSRLRKRKKLFGLAQLVQVFRQRISRKLTE